MKLDLTGLTSEEKLKAKQAAGSAIVDGIQKSLDSSESPVIGGGFKKKLKEGGDSTLFEFGDMRGVITFAELQDIDAIDVGIFDDAPTVEKLKAFNHNTGDTLPQRRFVAAPNQRFKDSVMKPAQEAIDAIKDIAESERRSVQEVLDIGNIIDDIDLEDIT